MVGLLEEARPLVVEVVPLLGEVGQRQLEEVEQYQPVVELEQLQKMEAQLQEAEQERFQAMRCWEMEHGQEMTHAQKQSKEYDQSESGTAQKKYHGAPRVVC